MTGVSPGLDHPLTRHLGDLSGSDTISTLALPSPVRRGGRVLPRGSTFVVLVLHHEL